MAHVSEIATIIIDPEHERYGEVGEMTFSGVLGDGTCLVRFKDGLEVDFNDGYLTGIPQFKAILKKESETINRLVNRLPDMQPLLHDLFEQVVNPGTYPPSEKTIAARAGVLALIDTVVNESTELTPDIE